MTSSERCPKIVIVGAGPVGALAGLYAAQRGYLVEIYEGRQDLRDPNVVPSNFTKSISLTLSERGMRALQHSGHASLCEDILSGSMPVYDRAVHGVDAGGQPVQQTSRYDVHGQALNVLHRSFLNQRILEALNRCKNVEVFYEHKLVTCNLDEQQAVFEQKAIGKTARQDSPMQEYPPALSESAGVQTVKVKYDLLIGADGAHSMTRQYLSKYARMDLQQKWIDILWCEFRIQPSQKNNHRLRPDQVHIWPQNDCMFLALPDIDLTFTCNLFATPAVFRSLEADPNSVIPFFQKSFPGVVPDLISPADITRMFTTNPHLPLLDLRCRPYNYGNSFVIIGDAAHAMVPFYAQGLNAGFEDVQVLFEDFIDNRDWLGQFACSGHPADILDGYSKFREPDIHTINELAMENYHDMRIGVHSRLVWARRRLEQAMKLHLPALDWDTLYRRVAFSGERYSVARAKDEHQRATLVRIGWLGALSLSFGATYAWSYVHHSFGDLAQWHGGLLKLQ